MQDIRGVYQGRGTIYDEKNDESEESSVYKCRLDCFELSFVTLNDEIIVTSAILASSKQEEIEIDHNSESVLK